jgi:YD repeat-containing protein
MNKSLLILAVILLIGFQSACNSSEEHDKTVEMPDLKVEKGNTGNEVVFNDSGFEKQKSQVPTFGDIKQPQTYTDKDGSEVRISFDAAGNKIGIRKFFNHQNLTFLQITETSDGTKEGIVFGHNGEKKRLTPELIQDALNISGDELARTVGIYGVKREKTRETAVKNTQVPFYPSQTFPTQESYTSRQPTPTQPTENQLHPETQTQTEPPPVNPQTTQNGKIKGENQ